MILAGQTSIMKNNIPRVYADTSVYGGAFDEEFQNASNAFFEAIRENYFQLIVSDIIRREVVIA